MFNEFYVIDLFEEARQCFINGGTLHDMYTILDKVDVYLFDRTIGMSHKLKRGKLEIIKQEAKKLADDIVKIDEGRACAFHYIATGRTPSAVSRFLVSYRRELKKRHIQERRVVKCY